MYSEAGAVEWLANLSIAYIVAAAFVLTTIRLALAPNHSPFARSVAELVESLLIAGVLVFLIIRPFFLQAFYIPSESMEPTLLGHEAGFNPITNTQYTDSAHDQLFVNKLVYRFREPQRGDIIVFRAEKKADRESLDHPSENVLIKRLIGIPGDSIEVKPDDKDVMRVWINGKPQEEPYIKGPMLNPQPGDAIYGVGHSLKLGPGRLFVMGDNRNNSNDSRFWGTLPRDRVIGKAMFLFWPPRRIGLIR